MKKVFYFVCTALICCCLTACNSDDGDNQEEQRVDWESESKILFDTTWEVTDKEFTPWSGFSNPPVFTLSSMVHPIPDPSGVPYTIIVEGKIAGYWGIENDILYMFIGGGDLKGDEAAQIEVAIPEGTHEIITLTSTQLVISTQSGAIRYFRAANPSSGGSSYYEKPDVGFYDFTATKTSLRVQYKIYNKDEAQVSNAKIYYGTSNNPIYYKSASVNGTLITADISGLKSGTTYYVKCVATGKGGTTTTSITKCITNY